VNVHCKTVYRFIRAKVGKAISNPVSLSEGCQLVQPPDSGLPVVLPKIASVKPTYIEHSLV
jgi:hypothetical protein